MLRFKLTLFIGTLLMTLTVGAQVLSIKETPIGISQRLQYEIDITKDPALGYVPKDRLVNAYRQRKEMVDIINDSRAASMFVWTERGPYSDAVGSSNGNTRANNGKTSGRVRAIWEDLGDATGKTVWVGGVDGGLWKTTDITANPATWTPINDFFGNLAVGSICQDPSNVNIMYFGTGEKAINADAVRGAGLWMSTDHGVTWDVMNSTSNFWNVSKVICDASGNLYVACNALSNTAGIQRYTKSTGTWTNITPSGLSSRIPDMELSSTGRLHITCGYYNTAASSSGYRYTDNPSTVTSATWTSPVTTFTTQYNVELASCGNTLYALPATSAWEVTTIYKSIDGGANWSAIASTHAFTSGQAWYCMAAAVDPNNPNNVIVGSLDCYKTTTGGTSWTKISNWVGTTGQYVHADQQIINWRNNNQVLVGCDGGVHYSADGGTTFTDRNVGLRLKQFYSVAVSPSSTNYFLAGAQDNGVHQLNGAGLTTSIEVTGGDGAFVHIDQDQSQYQWGSYVYNQYRRSTNSGSSWSSVNYSSSAGRFINPTDYDDVANIMYCSGSANQYVRWDNPQTGSTFTPVTVSLNNGTVSAIKVSPYSSNTVYFAGCGSGVTPVLLKATGANGTPYTVNIIGSGMTTASANISSIELGTSEQNIIVAYSNYGVNNVWVTTNGGTSWTNIDGNLPDMPVRWAMFLPGDNTKAVIGTETGVWTTQLINGTSTLWEPEATFPNVRTDMIQYRSSDGLFAVATHGRGLFSGVINNGPTCGTVTGLSSSAITSSSATLSWSALSGAISYDVDYKLNTSSTWTNAATATTSLSVNIGGLNASSLYDYRVRANCTGASGAYAQAQFTTSAPFVCNAPSGLASSAITSSSATVSWQAVSGAVSYDVDYKLNNSSVWINAATATTNTSVNLTGLVESSLYDWQVRTNCSGSSSAYTQAQFTTAAAFVCNSPSGLAASSITTSSATVSWSAVSGAVSYDVDYKLSTASTWTNSVSGTTSTSRNITGLTAGSLYDYRVRTNCNGSSSGYSQAQFTTTAAPLCPGSYDVSTNGTASGAATIPLNTDIYGLINPSGDKDYYKFTITTSGTATITLTGLPANYDLYLFSSNGSSQLASSRNGGTTSETISRTFSAGSYYAQVVGRNSANNASTCYRLLIQTGTATEQEPVAGAQALEGTEIENTETNFSVMVYPNPVSNELTIYMISDNTSKKLRIVDMSGRIVYTQTLTEMFTSLDMSALAKGNYIVTVTNQEDKLVYTQKISKD